MDRVRQRAEIGLLDEAEAATRATLTILGECLIGGEGQDLASQLPQGLAVISTGNDRAVPSSSLYDLLQQVGEREGVNTDETKAHTKVVMSVLQEAVSEGEMEEVRRQFPSEIDPRFE